MKQKNLCGLPWHISIFREEKCSYTPHKIECRKKKKLDPFTNSAYGKF
jgi:hypothetical protein